jgi:hypothetical protein
MSSLTSPRNAYFESATFLGLGHGFVIPSEWPSSSRHVVLDFSDIEITASQVTITHKVIQLPVSHRQFSYLENKNRIPKGISYLVRSNFEFCF